MNDLTRNSTIALMAACVLFFTVLDASAADRTFLGNLRQTTLAQSSDVVAARTLKTLRNEVAKKGKVKVIVGVRVAFAPEGKLADADVKQQRNEIAQMHTVVTGRIPSLKAKPGKARPFNSIPFMAMEVDAAELEALAGQTEVTSIEEDRVVAASLAESVPLIGGTAAWSSGFTGTGQTVAILDTGVDKTHAFLTGKVVSEACYSSTYAPHASSSVCPGGVAQSTAAGSAMPYAGTCAAGECDHGTHVAGIVAGAGASYSGVAKNASLIAIQVFSRFDNVSMCGGASTCVLTYTSDQILGLQRVYALRNTYSIAAVNMSLGGGQYFDQASCDAANSSVKAAIDNLRSVNIATVIASGNDGYSNSMGAPGCISTAVSVGSTWDAAGWTNNCSGNNLGITTANQVACYSNSASFINLLAPGSAITASIPGGGYALYHGTSMATPHVAGAWALLKQHNPNLTVSNALTLLAATGVSVTDTRNSVVKPRIRIDAAISAAPALAYSSESGYSTVGVSPSSGTAATTFIYKVVYTHKIAPASISACIDAVCSAMSVDASAAAALHDGSYANGEQYAYSTTLGSGSHVYYFTASDGGTSVNLPASASLDGPTVSGMGISTSTLANGTVGAVYSQTLAASGGVSPYTWSVPGLPAGLNLNASSGAISGTPTAAGYSGFTASVTDAASTVVNKVLSITVNKANQTITFGAAPVVAAGGTGTVSATGGASGNALTYTSLTTSVCTISGSTVTGVIGGTCTIAANQAGNANYNAATQVTQSFSVSAVSSVDLVMGAVSTASTSVPAAGSFILTNTERNSGSTAMTAASNVVDFYLSTDALITAADTKVGTRTVVGKLAAGASNSASTTIKVPGTLTPGVYYIGAIADATNVQAETNESNNTLAGTTLTVTRDVDLVMSAVSTASTSVPAAGSFIISNTERNNGTTGMTVSGNTVDFYLSTDALITAADTKVGTRSVPGLLAAGASNSASTTVNVPGTLTPGVYYIGAIADAANVQVETSENNNTLAGTTLTVTRNVDLVMSAVSTASTSVPAAGSFIISNTERNNGTTGMTVSGNTVDFYLSTDALITAADTKVGTRSVPGLLAAGASNTAATTVKIPGTVVPGVYYIGAIADATNVQVETNENNNTLAGTTLTVTRNVDLVMSAVSTASTSVPAAGSFIISNTETNNGTTGMTVSGNTVDFYLSTDALITAADTKVGTRSVPGLLAAGASNTAATTVKIPGTVAPGVYYIGVIADATNVQAETTESNNTLAGTTLTVTRDVDLVMSAVSTASTSVPAAGSFIISNTETNNGTTGMTVSGNTVDFYLSTDALITAADTKVGTRSVPGLLAAGASNTAATTVKIPGTVVPGVYYIGVIADATNVQVETTESNNTLAGTTITVTRDVDLVMSAVSTASTSVPAAGSFIISNTETNNGTTGMTVSGNTVDFYLSTDALITAADTKVGTRSVPGLLAAGASNTAATTVKIPGTVVPGVYYIGVIADATNVQVETNENNNTLAGTTITVTRDVDLVMSAVSTASTSVPAAGSFIISNTETNNGTTGMTVSGNTVDFYLSTDALITAADTKVGTRSVPGLLAAGASNTAATTVKIPGTVVPGVYYIGVIADATNVQVETNESNNTLVGTTITVARDVDLVMSAVSTASTSVPAAGSFIISNTETNNGTTGMTVSGNTVDFYLSTDALITAADTKVGTRSVTGLLAAGASNTAATTVKIPGAVVPGVYYIGVIADAANVQTEINESNNTLAGTTLTVTRDVDLVMSAVSTASTSVPAAGSFIISNTERNNGTTGMTVSGNTVDFYLSTDALITAADTKVGTRSVTGLLAAGASNTAATTVKIPGTVVPGVYYIGAIADAANVQIETTENNNTLAGTTLTVTRDVDLVMSAVSTASTSVPAAGSFIISNTERNNGTTGMTVSGNTVDFYLSTDALITAADTKVGTRSVPGLLAAGASNTAATTVKIPGTVAPGVYYIGVIADAANVQVETTESNNTLAGTTITVTRDVDLVMSAVSTASASVARAGSFIISNTERNNGTTGMTVSGNTVDFYLSTDALITAADTKVGTRSVPGLLAAGASSSASTTVKIPGTVAPGVYYIGAIADAANVQIETTESNNTLAGTTITVTP